MCKQTFYSTLQSVRPAYEIEVSVDASKCPEGEMGSSTRREVLEMSFEETLREHEEIMQSSLEKQGGTGLVPGVHRRL